MHQTRRLPLGSSPKLGHKPSRLKARLHTVCIIGLDQPDGYWIITNSFGPTWEDDGFARLIVDAGDLLAQRRESQIVLYRPSQS
ncbi:hypothetical protein RXE43_000933 [Pseudomonas aeruginosa]|uniref:C1 family peptidase n=1 Tax=Pseudomonas aeruginosa TaxID=287 RepID=UPI0008FB902E|nr:hypothetical protein [Pseudomonas aeruginosa]EJV1382031.1 hypothetical protein [Pseudomonas aeruginosa]EJV1606068.1 hypothetical protein [Pseudomonas aeruginosa]EKD1563801.1 hypothetical protein [Pseudomonas aeruginosa]EKJ6945820.1 hypothetical protein [Pseudomonas aeruginosa]